MSGLARQFSLLPVPPPSSASYAGFAEEFADSRMPVAHYLLHRDAKVADSSVAQVSTPEPPAVDIPVPAGLIPEELHVAPQPGEFVENPDASSNSLRTVEERSPLPQVEQPVALPLFDAVELAAAKALSEQTISAPAPVDFASEITRPRQLLSQFEKPLPSGLMVGELNVAPQPGEFAEKPGASPVSHPAVEERSPLPQVERQFSLPLFGAIALAPATILNEQATAPAPLEFAGTVTQPREQISPVEKPLPDCPAFDPWTSARNSFSSAKPDESVSPDSRIAVPPVEYEPRAAVLAGSWVHQEIRAASSVPSVPMEQAAGQEIRAVLLNLPSEHYGALPLGSFVPEAPRAIAAILHISAEGAAEVQVSVQAPAFVISPDRVQRAITAPRGFRGQYLNLKARTWTAKIDPIGAVETRKSLESPRKPSPAGHERMAPGKSPLAPSFLSVRRPSDTGTIGPPENLGALLGIPDVLAVERRICGVDVSTQRAFEAKPRAAVDRALPEPLAPITTHSAPFDRCLNSLEQDGKRIGVSAPVAAHLNVRAPRDLHAVAQLLEIAPAPLRVRSVERRPAALAAASGSSVVTIARPMVEPAASIETNTQRPLSARRLRTPEAPGALLKFRLELIAAEYASENRSGEFAQSAVGFVRLVPGLRLPGLPDARISKNPTTIDEKSLSGSRGSADVLIGTTP
jgi:hypothetical protein